MAEMLWPLPKTPEQPTVPDPSGVVQQLPGIGQIAAKAAQSPSYQALKGQPEKSFGAAGLIPGAGVAAGLAPAAAVGAGALAAPAALAYGIGKLVAPRWTDQTVGKIKDWLANQAAPALNQAEAVGSAYETGMLQSIPGSQFLQKKIPALNDYLETIKSQHPQAAKMGQAAGTIGQFAIPGMNVVKGAGLLPVAANAAINAAPWALGHGLDVGATTGDVGKGVRAGLGTEALGTAAPVALSALSKIPAVQRWLTKIQLSGAGIRTGDSQKNLRTYASHTLGLRGPAVDSYVANQAAPLEERLGGLVDKFGQGRAGKEAMRKWNNEGFDAHNSIYEAVTGNHVGTSIGGTAGKMSDADHVLSDPDLVENLTGLFTPQQIQDAVKAMGEKIDGLPWNQARNKVLNGFIQAGRNAERSGAAADSAQILQAHVAQAWHNQIDSIADRAMSWAKEGALGPEAQAAAKEIPDLTTLKSTYPAIQTIKRVQGREEPFIPTNAPGTDTFARAATDAILSGSGAIVGGPAGAAAAQVVGPILARGIGKVTSKGAGAAAGALNELLRNAAAGGAAPGLFGKASAIPGIENELSGPTVPTGSTMQPQQMVEAPPAEPIPNAPVPPPAPEGAPPGAQPIPNASPQDQMQAANAQFTAPAQEPQKAGEWNDAFVNNRMVEKWNRYQRQYGEIPFEQYKQAAMNATQGLDPKLPLTWQAMFDDKETATRLYNGYMNLQKVANVDPGAALNHYTRLFQLGPRISGPERQKETEDNARLVQALADMTKQPVKEIDNRLRQIAWSKNRTPEQKKQAVIDMIVQEGGVDVPLLVKMGLW